MRVGETATEAAGKHLTGMHSYLKCSVVGK